jgi:hypothetical protein
MSSAPAVALCLGALLLLTQPLVTVGVRKGESLTSESESTSSSSNNNNASVAAQDTFTTSGANAALYHNGGCGDASEALTTLRGTTFRYSEVFQGVTRSYWAGMALYFHNVGTPYFSVQTPG